MTWTCTLVALLILAALAAVSPDSLSASKFAIVINAPDVKGTAHIVHRHISTRCACRVVVCTAPAPTWAQAELRLIIDSALGPEGYRVMHAEQPAPIAVVISGGDLMGVAFGAGRFLHDSHYTADAMRLSDFRGQGGPARPGAFRALYFATHFNNFYQAAPMPEVQAYMEDLALWGANTITVTLAPSYYSSTADPPLVELQHRTAALLHAARGIGMRTGLVLVVNEGLATRPSNISYTQPPGDRPRSGNLVCPHKGRGYLLKMWNDIFRRYAQLAVHLDYLVQWAWDWGGCGCPQDWPWGAVGYPRLAKALHDLAQATHPGVVSVASTWDFDKPEAGEFAGLDGWIRTNPGIFSAVVADGHDDFPAWPLQHGGVGGLPVVGFPEISMWGRSPWGGYGANPMPGRFQRFWEEARGLLQGGMPYSEGIYEDLNKVISLRHFWDGSPAVESVRQYIRYEFGPAAVPSVTAALVILEATYPNIGITNASVEALQLLGRAEAEMTEKARGAWRWRVLYLRGLIDATLFRQGKRLEGPVLAAAFRELTTLYHAEHADDWVRPPRVTAAVEGGS